MDFTIVDSRTSHLPDIHLILLSGVIKELSLLKMVHNSQNELDLFHSLSKMPCANNVCKYSK